MNKTIKALFIAAGIMITAGVAQAAPQVTVGQQAGYCAATYHALGDRLRQTDPKKYDYAQAQFSRVWNKYVSAPATAQDFSRTYSDTSAYYARNHYNISLQQLKDTGNACLQKGF